MDEMLQLLKGVLPAVDFANETALVDDNIIDSLDIVTIITELSTAYGIEIPPDEIVQDNFNSLAGLYAMVERLNDE